jgi:hypothetical protein
MIQAAVYEENDTASKTGYKNGKFTSIWLCGTLLFITFVPKPNSGTEEI